MRPDPTHENQESPMSSPTSLDADELDIDELRHEIDRLDAEILAAVKRRTEVSQAIGKVRMASGGTRLVHSREMKVIDRKSTRLNSSHMSISYAVFCLKKKKIKEI